MRTVMAVGLGVLLAGAAWALDSAPMTVVTPDKVQFGPGPNALPAGAQMAVIEGDLSKPGPFTMRAKVPRGWKVPPHYHSQIEHVTVLQGGVRIGMGDTFDAGKMTALPVGSFFAMPARHHHFFEAGEDSIIQVHGMGPWDIVYLNPSDDPRKAKAAR
jgi:hypothetical protein